jgi:hypothetical protein
MAKFKFKSDAKINKNVISVKEKAYITENRQLHKYKKMALISISFNVGLFILLILTTIR